MRSDMQAKATDMQARAGDDNYTDDQASGRRVDGRRETAGVCLYADGQF